METATFRDQWVQVADEWKLKSRQQISGLTASTDKSEWNPSEDWGRRRVDN